MTEEERCRAEQIKAGVPHIGPLLDAWDGLMNDQRAGIKSDAPEFVERFQALYDAWMDDGSTVIATDETGAA